MKLQMLCLCQVLSPTNDSDNDHRCHQVNAKHTPYLHTQYMPSLTYIIHAITYIPNTCHHLHTQYMPSLTYTIHAITYIPNRCHHLHTQYMPSFTYPIHAITYIHKTCHHLYDNYCQQSNMPHIPRNMNISI